MQPYFFPYIGYFQLAQAVDEFIFFDDVNYIKKGFISRNAVLLNGKRHDFSVPVVNQSQNRKINEHEYHGDFSGFLRTLSHAYAKAPFFEPVLRLVDSVCSLADRRVSSVNAESIRAVFRYLGIEKTFSFSSELKIPDELRAQDRILEICRRKTANAYRNSIGGRELYDARAFLERGIDLAFIKTRPHSYLQGAGEFVPALSMIDVLMWNAPSIVLSLLSEYDSI